jgi:hypothetical protein
MAADPSTIELRTEIDKLVGQIKKAILLVEHDPPDGSAKLKITAVDLTVSAVATRTAEGNLKLSVFGHDFGADAKLTKEDTQTIELSLVPDGYEPAEFDTEDVPEQLADAIRALRASVADASGGVASFGLKTSSIELNLKVDADDSIDFVIGGEAERTNVQTLKLTLEPA